MLLNGSWTGVVGGQSKIHLTVPSIQLDLQISNATLDVLGGTVRVDSETVCGRGQELA